MENSAEKILIPRSKSEFLRYVDKNTKHIYMISEFIDNSIQSAIDFEFKNLNIDIKIDNFNEQITVIDNAGGIPWDKKEAALKNGKDQSEQGKTLNMFGVGMKMASIWFGRRLTIYTKHVRDNFAYKIILDVDELKDNDFHFTAEKIESISLESGIKFNYESGTIIKIDKFHKLDVHKKRYNVNNFKFKPSNEDKSLINKIASRYYRFIDDKNEVTPKVIMSLSYIDKDGKEKMTDNGPEIINAEKVFPMYIGNYKNIRNDYDYKSKVNGKNQSKNITSSRNYYLHINDIKEKYKDVLDQNVSDYILNLTYRDIFNKFENQEVLKFDCKLVLTDEYSNKVVNFTFGFMGRIKSPLKNYFGLSVYQDNRAIVSGPNTKEVNLNWLTSANALSDEMMYVNIRFIGTLDLDDKNLFRVDDNKIDFTGSVRSDIEDHIIKNVFKKGSSKKQSLSNLFNNLLKILFEKEDQTKINDEINKSIVELVEKIEARDFFEKFSLKSNKTKWDNRDQEPIETNSIVVNSKQNDEKVFEIVQVIESIPGKKDKLFGTQYISEKNIFVIIINKDSAVFNKNIKPKEFITLINPLFVLVLKALEDAADNAERVKIFKQIFRSN